MTNQTRTSTNSKTDRNALLDLSIRLGHGCWGVYCCSKIGFIRVFMLPNGEARRRANELFQCGFSARMLFCPPTGITELDTVNDTPMGEQAWEHFLTTHKSKTILDGPAYPGTPKVVLNYAREFFLEGFSAGTVAVQEILNL